MRDLVTPPCQRILKASYFMYIYANWQQYFKKLPVSKSDYILTKFKK
jgi:hypothetical protein